MDKLKSFLITRLLILLGVLTAVEAAMLFLVSRVLLPFTAGVAQYTGTESAGLGLQDALQILRGLFMGREGRVLITGILGKIGVAGLLAVAGMLILLPVILGVLWYAGAAARRIDVFRREREEERAAYDAQRNLMFSDFAHDLRTPMMTISGYAGALADGMVTDPAQQQEYLEAIRAKSGRMSELINLLFDYTKLGSVNFVLKKERTDLNELLRETAAASYDEVENAGMELLIEIPEEPYMVQADRAQVSRVVTNLMINAVRHNPAGTKVAVGVRRMAGLEMVAVADTGVKIEKSAEQLFEPFVKGDDSRSESKGSGLGLSIAKKITDMHGWTIELRQPFGTYTKAFVISIPERAGEN